MYLQLLYDICQTNCFEVLNICAKMRIMKDSKSKDNYWIKYAEEVSKQSLCLRKDRHIGSVAVKDGLAVETGFNGVVGKIPPCAERGECIREKMGIASGTQREVAYCICAEQRMICNAARNGVTLDGTEVYVTHMPCAVCVRLMIEAGITKGFYKYDYPNQFTNELCEMAGFKLIRVK